MRLVCRINYKPGWLGFDHRRDFEVGKTYTVLNHPSGRYYVYSYLKRDWVRVYSMDILTMFRAVETYHD